LSDNNKRSINGRTQATQHCTPEGIDPGNRQAAARPSRASGG
jgi:hypothetical protein